MKHRRKLSIIIALTLIFSLLALPETAFAATKNYTQKSYALGKYNTT